MNNIFLCKTPYQILVVTRLVNTFFSSDNNDILISDTIADYEHLCKKVERTGVFTNVTIYHVKYKYQSKSRIYFVFNALLSRLDVFDIHKLKKKYDRLFICNIGKDESIIYRKLKKCKKLEVNMFEDGFSSYSKFYGDFFEKIKLNHSIRDKVMHFFRGLIYEVFMKINKLYAFSPELFEWNPSCELVPIPKIEPSDKKQIRIYNEIFGYELMEDKYLEPIIIFEESYYADQIEVGDLQLIQKIANIFGKENILVKIHPRNPKNRFKEINIKTNCNTYIPWEVIALNIDLSDKILITIASGSALTTLINTHIKPKKIYMLYNFEQFCNKELTQTLPFLKKLVQNYSEIVNTPNDMDTLFKSIKSNMRNEKNENCRYNAN